MHCRLAAYLVDIGFGAFHCQFASDSAILDGVLHSVDSTGRHLRRLHDRFKFLIHFGLRSTFLGSCLSQLVMLGLHLAIRGMAEAEA